MAVGRAWRKPASAISSTPRIMATPITLLDQVQLCGLVLQAIVDLAGVLALHALHVFTVVV